ncbi:MAG: MarR family transcriptional regulator [Candidatus Riflebacteria bacterium]|nr:MarR family transcriptional regulator [Candidatus Riflebacteria bacterium]
MSTHYHGTKEEISALDCFIKLLRAADSVNNATMSQIQANGLTESQFGILEALLHLGSLNQNQLAQKILKSGGNITLVIDNLLKHGLINKEKRKDDRRCYWISLSDKGADLINKLLPIHVKLITERLAVLSPEEQIQLSFLCKKLGKGRSD